jgi:hypothetical protein
MIAYQGEAQPGSGDIVEQLQMFSSADYDWHSDYESCIAYCASHFHELAGPAQSELRELGGLNVELLPRTFIPNIELEDR